jgi:hypothetical protein
MHDHKSFTYRFTPFAGSVIWSPLFAPSALIISGGFAQILTHCIP